MKNRRYCTILWDILERLDINLVEYAICDTVFKLQANPKSENKGWCYMSRSAYVKMLRVSKSTVIRSINKLVDGGLLMRSNEGYLQTTELWYNAVHLIEIQPELDAEIGGCQNETPRGVKMTPNNNIDNNRDNERDNAHALDSNTVDTRIKNTSVEVPAAAPQIHKPYLPIYEGLKGKLFKPEMDRAADLLSRPQLMLDAAFQKIVSIPGEKQSDILKKFLNEPKHDGLDYFASIRRFSNYVDTWSRNLSQRQTA